MLFYALLLCLASWSVDARSDYVGYIHPHTYTSWGSWGYQDWCPEGSYAYAFNLKVEAELDSGDDTALNGIKMLCRTFCGAYTHTIMSKVGEFGDWGIHGQESCTDFHLLYGAQARSERKQGDGDDTAANDYDFFCQNTITPRFTNVIYGTGTLWGSWSSRTDCPSGSYICGIRTQVESSQGSGDDTALNDAIFYCCTLNETHCNGKKFRQ